MSAPAPVWQVVTMDRVVRYESHLLLGAWREAVRLADSTGQRVGIRNLRTGHFEHVAVPKVKGRNICTY